MLQGIKEQIQWLIKQIRCIKKQIKDLDNGTGVTISNTSELINDGEDGTNPFITLEDINSSGSGEVQKIELNNISSGNALLPGLGLGQAYFIHSAILNFRNTDLQTKNGTIDIIQGGNDNLTASVLTTFNVNVNGNQTIAYHNNTNNVSNSTSNFSNSPILIQLNGLSGGRQYRVVLFYSVYDIGTNNTQG